MSFLSVLQEDLERVDLRKFKPAAGKIEDGQEVVGTLPEELRRLWAVRSQAHDAVLALKGEILQLAGRTIRQHEEPPELPELKAKYNLAVSREKALAALFWNALRHEFPVVHDKPTIGFTDDWQVYWQEPRRMQGSTLAAILTLLAANEDD